MKKILLLSLLFSCFAAVSFAQLKKQASFTVGEYGSIERANLGKLGEKFVYNDDFNVQTALYNSDGSTYKTIDKNFFKNTNCTVDRKGYLMLPSFKANGNFDYSYFCGNGSIGIADENGNSFFNTNEPVKDYIYSVFNNTFISSTGQVFSKEDSVKTFKAYENNNGVLTLKKTFTDSRTVWYSSSSVALYNQKTLIQITKDNKVNVFDSKYNLLFSVPIQIPNEIYLAGVDNVSQKLFNTDDKYEFVLWYFDKNFNVKSTIYDETGKALLSYGGFANINTLGTRMILNENNGSAKLLELPSLKEISKIVTPDYFNLNNLNQSVNIIRTNPADSTVSILDEKLLVVKKFKYSNAITNYEWKYTNAIQQPDGAYCFISEYTSKQVPIKNIHRVTFANGKTQDFKDYNEWLVLYGANGLETKIQFSIKDVVAKNKKIDVYSFVSTVGTNERFEPLTGVAIFPNPFDNELNIKLSDVTTGTTSISVSNQLGQILLKKESNDNLIDIKELANVQQGIYFITIENNGKRTIEKVIKN